jgi:hypothetical protein
MTCIVTARRSYNRKIEIRLGSQLVVVVSSGTEYSRRKTHDVSLWEYAVD